MVRLAAAIVGFSLFCASALFAQKEIAPFIGTYSGSAEMTTSEGRVEKRDLSVTIGETRKGFSVQWTSASYREDGRIKPKSYKIEFVPSGRGDVFSAAMKQNVFGHSVPLDPMKGEPYVWSRLSGSTLTVFSLFVRENGDYDLQEYSRTLAEGGLDLQFRRFSNGVQAREVEAFLARE